jgi:hypothetical protein
MDDIPSYPDAPKQASREPQVQRQLEQQDKALHEHDTVLASLIERLNAA